MTKFTRYSQNNVFIIAEAGCNHNGDLAMAERLVREAALAGADAVKFQAFAPELMMHPDAPKAAYQARASNPAESQFARLQRVRLDGAAHARLQHASNAAGIAFCSSVFDLASLEMVAALHPPFLKVPSGEITNLPLLGRIAAQRLPVLLSTGMSTQDEVERAVEALRAGGAIELALLHCVSAYPAPAEEANLLAIRTLQRAFDLPVGFSDHTLGIELAVAAIAVGAVIIEKHLTLDKNQEGGDHKASLLPEEFAQMVRRIRALGPSLGNGVKACQPSERDVQTVSRKSLVASRDIAPGEVLGEANLAALRPGTGISPAQLDQVAGRRATTGIAAGAQIGWNMIEAPADKISQRLMDLLAEGAATESDTSIRSAMELIQKNSLRGLCVVNGNGIMIGMVMDSDIRRAILKGANLDASVKTIMQTTFFKLTNSMPENRKKRLALMSDKLLVPVLDEQMRLVDYISPPALWRSSREASQLLHARAVTPPAKVLVIGGAGYIGSLLSRNLLRQGYSVRCLDALLYSEDSLRELTGYPNFEFTRGDCRDEVLIKKALQGVEAVVHLGEIVGDPACSVNPDFTIETNFMATSRLVDMCVKYGVTRFVFTSSCSVYGQNDEMVDEKSELNPVSLYARCKVQCEKAILDVDAPGFCATILRLSTVHGMSYRPRFDLVVNLLSIRALHEGKIKIFGGDQWRPFISTLDTCRGIMQVLTAPEEQVRSQIFNLGDSRENYTIRQVGEIISTLIPETQVEVCGMDGDPRNYRVNFAKIRDTLGFACEETVEDSVRRFTAEVRERGLYRDYRDPKYNNVVSLE